MADNCPIIAIHLIFNKLLNKILFDNESNNPVILNKVYISKLATFSEFS